MRACLIVFSVKCFKVNLFFKQFPSIPFSLTLEYHSYVLVDISHVEFYHNSKKGPVVDSKNNTLVPRGEVPSFAANKNAHSICIIICLFDVLFVVEDKCDMNSNRR